MPFDEEDLDPHGECRHEIERLRKALERYQDAAIPFLIAAKVIFERPEDYGNRIVMIGGLANACDLTKDHFRRLLDAAAPTS